MNENQTIIPLAWDSNFFGLKIGKLDLQDQPSIDPSHLLAALNAGYYDLIYVLSPSPENQRMLESLHAEFVDNKIDYCLNIHDIQPVHKETDVERFHGAPAELYDLAFQAGHESRYKKDRNFAAGEFERFYRTWVDNSVSKQIADEILVYREDGKIQGFVTLKITEESYRIGLLAVDTAARGKGIATQLITEIVSMMRAQGKSYLYVATQQENQQARWFYEKKGFTIHSQSTIYHLWTKNI